MPSLAGEISDVQSDNRPDSFSASGQILVPFLPRSSPPNSFFAPTTHSAALQSHSPQSRFASQTPRAVANSPFESIGSHLHLHVSPSLVRTNSDIPRSISSGPVLWPFRNRHEARLLHHYIVHLSIQVSIGPCRKLWLASDLCLVRRVR